MEKASASKLVGTFFLDSIWITSNHEIIHAEFSAFDFISFSVNVDMETFFEHS